LARNSPKSDYQLRAVAKRLSLDPPMGRPG
jgi:hypothetical protein